MAIHRNISQTLPYIHHHQARISYQPPPAPLPHPPLLMLILETFIINLPVSSLDLLKSALHTRVRIMSRQCNSDHASSPTSQIHVHIDTTSMCTCSPSVLWEKRQNSCIWPPGYHIVWSPPASPVSSLTVVPLLLPRQGNWTFSVSDAPYLLNGDFAVRSSSFPSFSFSLNPAYCSGLSLSVILLQEVFLIFLSRSHLFVSKLLSS